MILRQDTLLQKFLQKFEPIERRFVKQRNEIRLVK